jgi:hypothetical protein
MAEVVDISARRHAHERAAVAEAEDKAYRVILAAGEALEPTYGMDASECVLLVAMDLIEKRLGKAVLRDALLGHASCISDDPEAA